MPLGFVFSFGMFFACKNLKFQETKYIYFFQDLAQENELNVTDFKKFSDYLSKKQDVMESIVDETFYKTRSA